MKVTEKIAEYVVKSSYRSLPKEVIHQAKRCFLDLIGTTLGGAKQPLGKILFKTAGELGGKPQATVLGYGFKTSVLNAALINGSTAHALDFDDTHIASIIHPSAPVIPAVLAAAEWKRLSGKAALEAFILGFEVETRIGLGMGKKHYDRGWHNTASCGRFGSVVAAGKLLGLNVEQMKMALGMAGTQASGLRLVFGTMTKPFHPGKCAFDGLLSALLVQRGFTCAPNLIEGPKGYMEVLGVESQLEPMVKNLGKKYELMNNTFKPYAACLMTHPTIDAILEMRSKHHLKPEDVVSIDCDVAKFCLDAAGQTNPKTGLAGKFSTHYVAALALSEGAAGEDLFNDKKVVEPKLVALQKKVRAKVVPAYSETEAKVTITTKGGKKFSAFVNTPKGDPRNPPTDRELEDKFRALAAFVLPKAKIDRLVKAIWNLDKMTNIRQLVRMCY